MSCSSIVGMMKVAVAGMQFINVRSCGEKAGKREFEMPPRRTRPSPCRRRRSQVVQRQVRS